MGVAEEDEDEDEEIDTRMGAIMSKAVAGSDGLVIGYFKEADVKDIDAMLPDLQRILGTRLSMFASAVNILMKK